MALTRMTAAYRITTPMFCAGADPQQAAQAELRPASFKGALRFWFRALAWANDGDLKKVRDTEDILFGSTRTGQANVLFSLVNLAPLSRFNKDTELDLGCGYLAGQGLAEPDRERYGGALTKRPALRSDNRFEVRLLLKSLEHEPELRDALIALGLFGGLGSRARRGFGSLTLESLSDDSGQVWTAPRDVRELEEEIAKRLRRQHSKPGGMPEPPYTALSDKTRVVLLPAAGDSARDLLESLGKAFLHFRGYGRQVGGMHRVGSEKALQQFHEDHDEMLKAAKKDVRPGAKLRAPLRAAFGLPHNYRFGSIKTSVDVNADGRDRRASPVFFHIHHAPESQPVAVVTFLPAVFLPDPKLRIVRRKKPEPDTSFFAVLPGSGSFWQPIRDFLAELLSAETTKLCEKFPGAVEIKR
jgi:CRISPR-associated protein Cmr1